MFTTKKDTVVALVERPAGVGGDNAIAVSMPIRPAVAVTKVNESSITVKEDALEQIMCAEAHAGFEQLRLQQLDTNHVTRCCVNPDRMPVLNMGQFSGMLDGDDVRETESESDGEFGENAGGVEAFSTAPHEANSTEYFPEDVFGSRFGFSCPLVGNIDDETSFTQDRVFAARCGNYHLLGIANGHGRSAIAQQLVALIAEEMPKAIFRSPRLTRVPQPGEPAVAREVAALTSAFNRVHRKASMALDLRLTGASVTVLLVDSMRIWVAHVGDCRAVLGIPDPKPNAEAYHYSAVPLTEDHKLAAADEFDRIEYSGGEVRRLVNDNTHRLFVRDSTVPGLTLTRGIGHRIAHGLGVLHSPAVGCIALKELNAGSFVVLGSGGIWSTMSERGAVNWVGKYFTDAHQAAQSLAEEAGRRWEDPSLRKKPCLRPDEPDSFSCVLFFPTEVAACPVHSGKASIPRPFALCPQEGQDPDQQPERRWRRGIDCHEDEVKRTWKEVKAINWKQTLEKTMASPGGRGKERAFAGSVLVKAGAEVSGFRRTA